MKTKVFTHSPSHGGYTEEIWISLNEAYIRIETATRLVGDECSPEVVSFEATNLSKVGMIHFAEMIQTFLGTYAEINLRREIEKLLD